MLRISQSSVINWERGDFQPTRASTLARIIEFLGYDPLPAGETIPDRLRTRRQQLGWSQQELAERFGIDPCTVTDWEKGGTILKREHRVMMARFLGLTEANVIKDMSDRWNRTHGRRPTNGVS